MEQELSIQQRVERLIENYSAGADVYQRRWAEGLRDSGLELLGRLPLADAEVVVDIGAGVGALLEDLGRAAPSALVIGTDRSEGMIALSNRTFPIFVGDAAKLPLAAQSIDVVTMLFMVFHLPDPVVGLSEVRAALRPGGRLGIATWGQEEDWPAIDMLGEILDEMGAAPLESLMSQHDLVNAPEKLEGLLVDAGLEPSDTWTGQIRRTWDVEGILEFAIEMASSAKRRLDTLDPQGRLSFREEARKRLAAATPRDLNEVSSVVFAIARRP